MPVTTCAFLCWQKTSAQVPRVLFDSESGERTEETLSCISWPVSIARSDAETTHESMSQPTYEDLPGAASDERRVDG